MKPIARYVAFVLWLESRTIAQRAVLAIGLVLFLVWLFLVSVTTAYNGNLLFNMWVAFLLIGIPFGLILGCVQLIIWVSHGRPPSR